MEIIRHIIVELNIVEIMISFLALIVSVCALLATFYQLKLQRDHNKKSIKPLGQIDVSDHKNIIYVHIKNLGLGPLIVRKIEFTKNNINYNNIADVLPFDTKSYMHVNIEKDIIKTVLPNGYLPVYEKKFYKEDGNQDDEKTKNEIRKFLSEVALTVYYTDMYDEEYVISRKLDWFIRNFSIVEKNTTSEGTEKINNTRQKRSHKRRAVNNPEHREVTKQQ